MSAVEVVLWLTGGAAVLMWLAFTVVTAAWARDLEARVRKLEASHQEVELVSAPEIVNVANSWGPGISEREIDQMVDRFLKWTLPADFDPDGGIDFSPLKSSVAVYWPVGTNLLTAEQAKQMVLYMVGAGGDR